MTAKKTTTLSQNDPQKGAGGGQLEGEQLQ
jgi:hypothetical protein